ncbi:transmembrane protein, putative (macronuclear) [Tetrahymena thermophila SB210]|uniref:Transmembrane protein, putative n=1 Tax=Tetrahymena thermophila (strain SB210) TaxID=312017 RepID=I7MLI4_TETTS|nr:transmembrane protein, putative [Tetrahymena thermophila SB210]EAS02157.2 transmembrane protein, putative [Tetrahymena thermophila SB210]|eukprot:XP_001022402.2 transmembrane protein, putative [Tetrahymena thermophila SB210]
MSLISGVLLLLITFICSTFQQNPTIPGCFKSTNDSSGQEICQLCQNKMYPPPLPTQFSTQLQNICKTQLNGSQIQKKVYITNELNACRSNLNPSTNPQCQKHPQLQVCACSNYQTACGGQMDGSINKPYDNLFEALLIEEQAAQNSFDINIQFFFINQNKFDPYLHEVIINEYLPDRKCIGTSFYVDETIPLHFFARKNAILSFSPLFCDDQPYCYKQTDKITLSFKKFAFHISTFGQINLSNIIIEGKDAIQEFLISNCTYQRGLECCINNGGTITENDEAFVTKNQSDRLGLFAFGLSTCTPLVSFVNTPNYPSSVFGTQQIPTIQSSSDFRLENNKYQNRQFGLFNVEFNLAGSDAQNTPNLPQVIFTNVEIRNIHILPGIYTIVNSQVTNYGFNTIRSIINIYFSAQIQIIGTIFQKNYLSDGFLTNLFDYNGDYTSLNPSQSPNQQDCTQKIPCASILIQDSVFSDFNDLMWYIGNDVDQQSLLQSTSRSLYPYSILLVGYQGQLKIQGSNFQNALPCMSTDYLFCPKLNTMQDYVEQDSQKKLWFPGYSYQLFEYSQMMNSHIILVDFLGKLDVQTSTFQNNTSWGAPAISIRDITYTGYKPSNTLRSKKEIYFYKNNFINNVGIFYGSAIRIVRYSYDYQENFCGPILFDTNKFTQNLGCRSNYGTVNIHCLFGSTAQIQQGITKMQDLQLDQVGGSDFKTFAKQGVQSPSASNYNYITVPSMKNQLPHEIIFTGNIFQNNMAQLSNCIYVLGSLSIQITQNQFLSNGVLHTDLYFLMRNTNYNLLMNTIAGSILYQTLNQGFIIDDGTKFLKETTSIFLDLCDKITLTNNNFFSNWGINTGDGYIGSSINIFRTVSFHGFVIQGNSFKNHTGIPFDILRQNIASKLSNNKHTTSIISLNVLSFAQYMGTFNIEVDILQNTFQFNTYYFDYNYIVQQSPKNLKYQSYIIPYPEINKVQLIKFYYNFDVSGSGPNAQDPQNQISADYIVNINQNTFTNNVNLNGLCMIHLIGGDQITFQKNIYTYNDNDYPNASSSIKYGLQGQICTTDKLGILGKTNSYNQIQISSSTFSNNKGKIITHLSSVSLLSSKDLTFNINSSSESLVDIITVTNSLNPTVLTTVTGTGNIGMTHGIINIMDSQYINIVGSTFSQNKANSVNAITILDSHDIQIQGSSFLSNSFNETLINPYLGLKPTGQYFSTQILANSSNVIISDCKFQNNNATHGGAIFLSSFSTITVQRGQCISNQAFTAGCFYIQKNSNMNTQNVLLQSNSAQLAGGAVAAFDQSQYTDQSDNQQTPPQSQFIENNSENGGAIYSQTSTIAVYYTQIIQNKAQILGSGVSLYISTFTAENILVKQNFCQGSASISMMESIATINESTFQDNESTSQTYGIRSDRSKLTITLCSFSQGIINTSDLYYINGGYINLSEGQATISNTNFTKGAGFLGGAIYSGFDTVLTLNSCFFEENSSLNIGGSIYSFISSQVNVNQCKFDKSSSLLSGSDIYGDGTNQINILETVFGNITGTSVYGLSVNLLSIYNSTFQNQETPVVFDEIVIETRGAQCELCNQVKIDGFTYFKFLKAQKGSGFYIDNTYKTYPTQVIIRNTLFFKNQAYQGAGAYMSGNITSVIENVIFDSNYAYQPKGNTYLNRTSGKGGGLVYDCSRINPSCTILFKNGTFVNNTATMQGGGFQWNDRIFDINSVFTFSNNKALYGADIASYAVCIIKVTTLNDQYPDSLCYNKEVDKGTEIVTRFSVDNIASGQNVDNANYFYNTTVLQFMAFALVDHLNLRIKSDDYSKITILPVAKLTSDDTGWNSIFVQNNECFAQQGFFNLKQLILATVPGSIIELSAVTNGIPYRLDRQTMRRRNLQSGQTIFEIQGDEEHQNNQIESQNPQENRNYKYLKEDRFLASSIFVQKDQTQITQTSDATIQVQLRQCVRGEIMMSDYTCYLCPAYKFSLLDTKDIQIGGSCSKCDNIKSICIGGYYIAPKAEYWRLDSYKSTFYECPKQGACLGYKDNTFSQQKTEDFIGYCKEGHMGNLCDSCISGWAMYQNQYCVPCNNNITYWIRVGFTIIIAFAQIVMAVRSTLLQNQQPLQKNAILMKMIMNFVQSVFIFTSFGIKLPSLVSSGLSQTNQILAAPLQVFNFECIYTYSLFVDHGIRSYFAQTIIVSLIPIIFSFLAVLYWCLAYYAEYGREAFVDQFYKREIANKLTVSIIIMLFTLLPQILNLTLQAYKCVNLSDDSNPIYYLKADYDIVCWESQHWYFIIFVAGPSLIIWGIVCPMQLFHFFHEKKERLFEKEYIEAYGFLLRGYTKKSISNEFIIFYRKLILIVIGIYVDFSSQTQVLLAFGVLVISLTYHNSKQPYQDVIFNNLETKSLLCQSIILISLLYIASTADYGAQLLFLLILFISYSFYVGNAVYYYLKETILNVFQGFYNNVALYNLIKMLAEKTKIKLLQKLQIIFKEKFLPLDYDHQKEINRMFSYLEQNSNLMDENFAKRDEFIHLKRESKLKYIFKQKAKEQREIKKKIEKQKKIEKKKEKQAKKSILVDQKSQLEQQSKLQKSPLGVTIEMESIKHN